MTFMELRNLLVRLMNEASAAGMDPAEIHAAVFSVEVEARYGFIQVMSQKEKTE